MKKRLFSIALITLFVCCIGFCSYAAQWCQDNNGWWWQEDNGSYPVNCWQWIDGNNDGTAECYYFDNVGYCMMGTTTPDGYYVDPNGAWTVNGVIQQRTVGQTQSVNTAAYSGAENASAASGKSKAKTMNLASAQVTTKDHYSYIVDAYETMLDGAFGKCIVLRYNGYIEFYLGNQYRTLTLTYAPGKGMKEDYVGVLEVYGDDIEGDLLYESDDINYRTHSKTVQIDVEACEFLRLKEGCNITYSGYVLLKGTLE